MIHSANIALDLCIEEGADSPRTLAAHSSALKDALLSLEAQRERCPKDLCFEHVRRMLASQLFFYLFVFFHIQELVELRLV